jgi:hypothetical protein
VSCFVIKLILIIKLIVESSKAALNCDSSTSASAKTSTTSESWLGATSTMSASKGAKCLTKVDEHSGYDTTS